MLIFNCFATFVAVGLGFIGLVKLRTHNECLAVVINYVLQTYLCFAIYSYNSGRR